MRFLALAGLVCGLWPCTAFADDVHGPVQYQLTPVMERGALKAVAIELRFKGEADGETMLELPDSWGGQEELWRAVTGLTASGAGVQLQPGPGPASRVIKHMPNADVTVSYRIVQDVPGEPSTSQHNPYRPIVQPGYFHLIGNAVFAVPAHWDDQLPVEFSVTRLPAGWRFASDLEQGKLKLGSIRTSVLVGGDFRIVTRPGLGGFLRLALRGIWQFGDDQLANKIARIVASHNAFWGEPNTPFLVTLIPLKRRLGETSIGGTGLDGAFALFASDNATDAQMNSLLAHEHTHTWIPGRIGRMPEKDEARDYWLSEGFTDFYAYRLLVRDGLWSIEDFAAAMNETFAAYWSSPVRTEPNARVVADFWHDQYVQKLPYQRGFLLGFIWDKRLREASKGARDLDDVVLEMKARFVAQQSDDKAPMAADNFANVMRGAGVDPAGDIARFVAKGETIALPSDVFAPCGAVATLDLPEFTRGFDPEKTAAAGNVVTGTDPEGPAYAAGMRDGMKIIKREAGRPGDSRVELVYRVDDHGTERIIRYKPEGKKRITPQEFQLTANMDAAARTACAARLGGT